MTQRNVREQRRWEVITKPPFWKLPMCWLGMCAHFTNHDSTGCWGECCTCGKRVGFVDSATLRRYADRHAPSYCVSKGQSNVTILVPTKEKK